MKVVIEQIGPRKRGIVTDESLELRFVAFEHAIAKGTAVIEMDVRINDCRPVGRNFDCHEG